MQNDGNFVGYDCNDNPTFVSQTPGNEGARAVIQDDGNLVVYSRDNRALWSSGSTTHC
jgi:hypothetical protein